MTRLMTTACAAAMLATPAMAEFELTILHTNDFHSRFEPISAFDSGCSAEDNAAGECFGGYARLVTAIRDAKERAGDNHVLVDGGDQFQGTLFYTYYKGVAAAEMMNALGYTAMTVGNHEFDDGPEVLRSFVDAVDFPILMSNADVSGEPLLADAIQKSTIIEVAGERIGMIGLTPQNTDELASPGPNVIFTDPSGAVQQEVDRLTGEGVNKIVVLSHSGYEVDKRVAENTTGVDVIVGGHSNTLLSNTAEGAEGPYPTMVNDVAIVQAYAYGKYLGELNVTFDDDGAITETSGDPLVIDGAVVEDAPTVERVAELAGPLDTIRNEVVAQSPGFLEGDRTVCRVEECAMGNLIADAMLARTADQGIDVAVMNSGGIRASIEEGEVTKGDVLTVLPFQNTLSTFRMTGEGLMAALENSVSQVEEEQGRFLQIAGMRYTWDASAEPGGRVTEVEIADGAGGFAPLDPAATYGVVSNNFVRGGGDGFSMFASDATDVYDFGPDLADVLSEHMAGDGIDMPEIEQRITRLN